MHVRFKTLNIPKLGSPNEIQLFSTYGLVNMWKRLNQVIFAYIPFEQEMDYS